MLDAIREQTGRIPSFHNYDSVQHFICYAEISLATGSLLCGLFQIIYCCLFSASGLGIWNGLLLYFVGFYGLCCSKPSANVFAYSHLLVTLLGLAILAISSVALHCTAGKVYLNETYFWQEQLGPWASNCNICTICFSVSDRFGPNLHRTNVWRNFMRVRSAYAFSETLPHNYAVADTIQINISILGLTLIIGLAQALTSLYVIWNQFFEFWAVVSEHVNIYYLVTLLGLCGMFIGTGHTVYCAHYFYIGGGIWMPIPIIVLGIYGNITRESERKRRENEIICLSWATIACSLALSSIAILGFYCKEPIALLAPLMPSKARSPSGIRANPVTMAPVSYGGVCQPPSPTPEIFQRCYERLEWMGYWHRSIDPTLTGLKRDHMAFCAILFVVAFLSCILATAILQRARRKLAENSMML